MKQKTERRLEALESETKTPSTLRVIIRDPVAGTVTNMDGSPYVDEPLPSNARLMEIVIVDPPNRTAVDSQVLH